MILKSIHVSEPHGTTFYMLVTDTSMYYVATRRHSIDKHICAYVNIDRHDWLRVADKSFESDYDVTFASISSAVFYLPKSISDALPIQLYDFWVGFDWGGANVKEPTQDEIVARIMRFLTAYKELLTETE